MHDGAVERVVDRVVDRAGHQQRSARDQSSAKRLGECDHVRLNTEMMGREKAAGPVHAGLHFIQYEERTVATTEGLGSSEVLSIRHADSAFTLNRLQNQRRESPGGK